LLQCGSAGGANTSLFATRLFNTQSATHCQQPAIRNPPLEPLLRIYLSRSVTLPPLSTLLLSLPFPLLIPSTNHFYTPIGFLDSSVAHLNVKMIAAFLPHHYYTHSVAHFLPRPKSSLHSNLALRPFCGTFSCKDVGHLSSYVPASESRAGFEQAGISDKSDSAGPTELAISLKEQRPVCPSACHPALTGYIGEQRCSVYC
jgi:hypothetical protein